jgi:small subunit ribosomal protein S7
MRKTRAKRRIVEPDPKFQDVMVTRFINNMMFEGRKSTAATIFYTAMEVVEKKAGENGLEVWRRAMGNVMPAVEVKSRRVGGATYQVPMEVRSNRGSTLALRWLVHYARTRGGKTMAGKLANEIMDAANETGGTIKKREETHRMAEANKAFAHYRY